MAMKTGTMRKQEEPALFPCHVILSTGTQGETAFIPLFRLAGTHSQQRWSERPGRSGRGQLLTHRQLSRKGEHVDGHKLWRGQRANRCTFKWGERAFPVFRALCTERKSSMGTRLRLLCSCMLILYLVMLFCLLYQPGAGGNLWHFIFLSWSALWRGGSVLALSTLLLPPLAVRVALRFPTRMISLVGL